MSATNHFRNAILCLSHFSSHHHESLLLDILTPSQAALFLEWFRNNKERCKAVADRQRHRAETVVIPNDVGGVCKQLVEIMSVDRKPNSSAGDWSKLFRM